jgi:hypothetical protein
VTILKILKEKTCQTSYTMNIANPKLSVQKVTLEEGALRFIVPCSMSICGPSQSLIC